MRKNSGKDIEWIEDENGCFICTSHAKDKDGYSRKRNLYATTMVHRYIYEECFGFIPKGLIVRHKCDNPACINPEHLELGTQKDNVSDMLIRGRCNPKHGEDNNFVKLTKDQVLEIRNQYKEGKTQYQIAKDFKISQGHVSDIVNKKKRRVK